jgi:hypothetical protein
MLNHNEELDVEVVDGYSRDGPKNFVGMLDVFKL